MIRQHLRTVLGAALVCGLFSSAASADIDFQVRKMTRGDVPLGKGQCDIRLRVDGEVEVRVRGDRVSVRTVSGREARDDGSECNEPLPLRAVSDFAYEVRDRRGDIALISEPAPRTGFATVVRIRDGEGGEGRYHFRLSWRMDGGSSGPFGGPGNRGDDRRRGNGNPPWQVDRFDVGEAIRTCSDAVRQQITREHRYNNPDIQNARADNRPGRNDWIIGDATGRRGYNVEQFIFSCRVDFSTGRVREVDVRRR